MSEPKLISPLLDGYVMGDPISSHDGVRCCPAMQTDSGNKYIVKVISVPASQVKLDALLLAGAFRDPSSALSYFKELAEGVVEEAVLLQRLSRLEGYISYDSWQVVPMEDGEVGFDIYLSGPYRPTLERRFRKGPMTHLAAVNLGLDMCAALAVCRRSGYLYVDLKPGNIFICGDREYRIGDLGFIPTASLEYASLPEKYLSAYTAPEITDAYDPLNATMDIWSAGLILYQAYNGGVLPFEGRAPAEPLPPPAYADPEMARIILKACAPDPKDRWQDPLQMGQALVSYMQANSVNDTPIVPPAAPAEQEPAQETAPIADEEPSTEQILAEVDQALDTAGGPAEAEVPAGEEPPAECPAQELSAEEAAEEAAEDVPAGAPVEETPAVEDREEEISAEEAPAEAPELPCEEAAENAPAAEAEEAPELLPEPAEEASGEEAAEDAQPDLSAEAAAIAEELGVTEEVSQILAQAEELIAHEAPEPVVAPEPIDVPIPAPIPEEPEGPDTREVPAALEEEAVQEPAAPAEEVPDEGSEEASPPPRKRRGWIAAVVTLLLAAVLGTAGYLFYEHYYVQTILGITLSGQEDRLTVSLNTETDNELLTVFCTDTYGTTVKQRVSGGKATFDGLKPATHYTIHVEIDGFHKLIGTTTDTYDTAEQTSIVSFTAATGAEDGSVILSFTVQGPETGEWVVTYWAEGEEEKRVSFSGHMVTVTGLTVGSRYTFQLTPATALYMVGEDTLEYTASAIVYAENLAIVGFHGNALTAAWTAPEGVSVESWTVRCYNDAGYDKTVTVTETEAVFEDLDISAAYTVEVNAAGMTLGTRAYVSANSVTVGTVAVDDSNRNRLTVSWDYEGTAPEGGWLLLYSVDGSTEQQVVRCTDSSGVIDPVVPGSHYAIAVQPADGSTVFGGTTEYSSPDAVTFSGYLLTAADMYFRMCRTPANPEWGQYDVPAQDYTDTFAAGENASFAVWLNHEYNTSPDEIVTLFVIRDTQGGIVSTATQSQSWTSMWYRGFGRLNIPALPETPGSYTVEIYFNGTIVTAQPFTVV